MDLELVRRIAGPVVGALIGYFTNDIAVKMLFLPRKPIFVFGHQLPFTPGAIPKGKKRLAKAAGDVVAGALLTREDLEDFLLREETESQVIALVVRQSEEKLHDLIIKAADISEESYEEKRTQLCSAISREVVESIDARALVQEHGSEYLREKAQSSMLRLVLTDKRCQEIADIFADKCQSIVDEKGENYVYRVLIEKLDTLQEQTAQELLTQIGLEEEQLKTAVRDTYRRLVAENLDRLLKHINISGMITDKINAMSDKEIEELVLLMMKKELRMIVNLGALIGFALGLINLLLA